MDVLLHVLPYTMTLQRDCTNLPSHNSPVHITHHSVTGMCDVPIARHVFPTLVQGILLNVGLGNM